MGKQGIPMEPIERIDIINMYIEGALLDEIMKKTGFSDTAIIETIEDYERKLIDVKGRYKGMSIGVENGKFIKKINPIEFVEKE
ncbi:hypothetical protein [Tissierella praeacuta]|uniref:hypothetical protein n=1 Tax=Tissierella praeacuta TaxID=43131 RepID=UPI00333F4809